MNITQFSLLLLSVSGGLMVATLLIYLNDTSFHADPLLYFALSLSYFAYALKKFKL